jgi:hypothetical protein
MVSTKRLGFYISIFMALVAVGAQGGIHLPLGIPESWNPYIVSWDSFILSLYVIINPFLPSDVIGPLAPLPSNITLTKATSVVAPAGTEVTKESTK